MEIKNKYKNIVDSGWDYSNGVEVSQETIDEWVKETYKAAKKDLNKKGFGYSKINSGKAFVMTVIHDFVDVNIVIVKNGYEEYNNYE